MTRAPLAILASAAAALAALVAGALTGCTQDVDPAWQLDHERVIAVRATPPRIVSGEVSIFDALIGHKGAPPVMVDLELAEVISPTVLANTLRRGFNRWIIVAPDAAALDAGRAELGIAAGEPVPVRVRVHFGDRTTALKVVWLGEHHDNPVLDPITIDGKDALTTDSFKVGVGVDIPLAVEFDDSHNINWLTSCGTMHDFDLAHARLRVEPADPQSGTLAVVVRDDLGGVAWRLWPISAE